MYHDSAKANGCWGLGIQKLIMTKISILLVPWNLSFQRSILAVVFSDYNIVNVSMHILLTLPPSSMPTQ